MRRAQVKSGILYAALAFSFWGIIPVYWKLLKHLSAWELLFHRVLWGIALLSLFMLMKGMWRDYARLREKKALASALVAASLIIANWIIFIWAVANGHVLEVSLGYFLNPLLNVVLGTVFLGEKLSRRQQVAVALTGVGLAIMFAQDLGAPWISLALASTFALYGFVRKRAPLAPVQGLAFEMFIGVVILLPFLGNSIPFAFPSLSLSEQFLAFLAGPITIFPLVLFNRAVKLIPYSTVGIIQFLAPTFQFLLAVLVFHEAFSLRHFTAFLLIWGAVAMYLYETLAKARASRQNKGHEV